MTSSAVFSLQQLLPVLVATKMAQVAQNARLTEIASGCSSISWTRKIFEISAIQLVRKVRKLDIISLSRLGKLANKLDDEVKSHFGSQNYGTERLKIHSKKSKIMNLKLRDGGCHEVGGQT